MNNSMLTIISSRSHCIAVLYLMCICPALTKAQDGATVYKTYCAGCHGASMEGNTATALVKEDWLYGRSKGNMIKNIKYGIEGTEMIAWGNVLSNEQVRALADFIVDAQDHPIQAIRDFPDQLTTADYILNVEVLSHEQIEIPWGIEFVDSSKALITGQTGSLYWMKDGVVDTHSISGLPKVYDTGRGLGGMMDIALDPDYEDNGWIYLAYVHTEEDLQDPDSRAMTRIVRGKVKDSQWIDQETVFQVGDSLMLDRGTRWGCRMLFDKDGYLFFTIGDVDRDEYAQDLARPNAKIFRIYPDGSIPEDNPFVENEKAIPAIYSIGNRNVQGIATHPGTGEIWFTEHGPMGGDELNILRKGANYGWPVITYGLDYSGDTVSTLTHLEGMEQPVIHWTPSIAVCPAEFCNSLLFPKWENQLFVGALAYEEVRKIRISGHEVLDQELVLKNYGRVRDIKFGPEGAMYVLINNPDAVLRITPESGLSH